MMGGGGGGCFCCCMKMRIGERRREYAEFLACGLRVTAAACVLD